MIFNKLFNSYLFVFDLYLEHQISPFYTPNISNTISRNKLIISKKTSQKKLNQIFISRDIPGYLNLNVNHKHFKKVKQYKGYLLNLSGYNNADDYIIKNLSSRNKKNLNSKKNKLFRNHKISSNFYFGTINKEHYNTLFKVFYTLLNNRFDEKKTHNRYLTNWSDLKTSTFQKILDKKASLHVIYDNLKPITFTLNFHLNDTVFSHIQTYDVNYSKYNMGDISMLYHLEWLTENSVAIFDLSMGKTYYKQKWSNHEYDYIYHVFYNKKSIISSIYSNIIIQELKFIQFLRDRNIIGRLFMLDKLIYSYKKQIIKQ
ncbi:hypothetical protein A8C32_03515 [Flavivirga aquatica]|uniref:BioF2-like acetyltransferase domain-containing protein n=1 Tax=Flavivirga aquatica TaxID=1849968 RepID=A0A1E5TAY0_9FLAO|nr:GNAT family N-acetyltransferase [Flavivirga aquatica]OEK08534.1 hypothetical protein A8C32_03515 [Flavivirga aquatica]